ncbi:MAG: hypothetical protein CSYNP_04433 [Syntrophus sp. SKADARSKE-3]|nr:hypothetical protein [Syntrophus sp. SKADARSKE-3]
MKRLSILWLIPCLLILGYAPAASAGITIKMGSDVFIEAGAKTGSIISIGGQVTIEGTVEGDVTVVGNALVLGKEALVTGNATSLGGIIVKGREARILGNQTEINSSSLMASITSALNEEWEEGWSWIFAIMQIAMFLCIIIIALIIVILIPGPINVISTTIKTDTFRTALWSILGLVMIMLIAVLLAISVIGIFLIPLEIIIVVCAAFVGFIAMGQLTGQRMYHLMKKSGSGIVRETLLGLIVLFLIGWIPYVGTMVKVMAVLLGLGGVVYSRFGTRKVLDRHANMKP